MLTKIILHIGADEYELSHDDLRNWDDVRCSYKRADYDGVVRSFTSKFEFVNRAKDILWELYVRDRFSADASLSVHTANDRWVFEERFRCRLDFSTVSMESSTLKIGGIDNSLAALIKANKNTKYEFIIGEELNRDAVLSFDRIPMMENVTYEFTQGTSHDDCADITVQFERGCLPFVGSVGSEIVVNKSLLWNDDQSTDPSSYLLRAYKDVDVEMEYELEWRTDQGYGRSTSLTLCIRRGGSVVASQSISSGNGGKFAEIGNETFYIIGNGYSSPSELPDPDTIDENQREWAYALVEGKVWFLQYNGHGFNWCDSGKTRSEYFRAGKNGKIKLKLKEGDTVFMGHRLISSFESDTSITVRIVKSRFVFSWLGIGDKVDIDVFSPKKIGTKLLEKISGGSIKADVSISGHDSRLSKTYIMAAESARGISGARFYSSFNEFCDWMSAVFGYVYYIGSPMPPKYRDKVMVCGQIEGSPWSYEDARYNGPVYTDSIVYIPRHAKFLYHDESGGHLYAEWPGCENYNDPDTGHPRTDTIYRILELSDTELYCFDEYTDGILYPRIYDHIDDYVGDDGKTVYFVHRSEILRPDAKARVIPFCRDFKFDVDSGAIYSTVKAGYDKKDYGNINGRDEFNFTNTYSTGCTVSEKTLSLLSKYRADCYGIEFAVQKRGEDTTDTQSDKDVFFFLGSDSGGTLTVDRSPVIENCLTDSVFNGAFSPMACIRANAGYICLQAESVELKFASSTGNSSVVIDGEGMSDSITLASPLATCGTIEFTTDDVDEIADVDEPIEVVDDGITYRGFLKEVDIKYARNEAATYKLIVKDIEL